ncbi:MAG: hypothetical protein N3A02_00230 [Rectinema sp.]|nr:hypothetical protein [Rectinema sp.]
MIAGSWIAGVTLLGERLGSKKAGLITNLPSNILVSLLFMALTAGPEYAAASTRGVPIGMAIDTVFVLVFIACVKAGLWVALVAALAVWIGAAWFIVVVLPQPGTLAAIALYATTALGCFAIAEYGMKIKPATRKPVSFSWNIVLIRAVFAGSVVAGAVSVAQIAPPFMTGVLATFPAVLTSTLVILTKSQGPEFTRATGKILILSSSNIIIYALVAGLTFVPMGPWAGTLLAFIASLIHIALLSKMLVRIK